MKTIKYIAVIVLLSTFGLSVFSLTASGQGALKTGYFVDNYNLRHKLNPALAPENGYVGIPVLGNIGLNVNSNIGASKFLYPLPGGSLGTFLHPDVSAETFLATLPANSYMNFDLNTDILSAGFYTGESSFLTVDLGLRANICSDIPDELFKFLKVGMTSGQPSSYDIRNFNIYQDMFAQVAVGYSMELPSVEGLRIGGKLKILLGIDNAQMNIEEMNINMSSTAWSVNSKANGYIAGSGINVETSDDGIGIKVDPSQLGIGGFGLGVDLGASYRFHMDNALDGLTISAAVTDLGFISYGSDKVTELKAQNGSVNFDGFGTVDIAELNVDDQLEELENELLSIVDFRTSAASAGLKHGLSTKVNLGVGYSIMDDKLDFGVLYSSKFGPKSTLNEVTLSANYQPVKWFDVSLSYSVLNTLNSFGFLLNFAPKKGLSIFVGGDYIPLRLTKDLIPLNEAFMNLNLGISIPIGKKSK